MDPSILGKRLAQARKKKGWTQEQLCREARVALNTVARLEQGHLRQLRTDTLTKVAAALNVSTDYLLGHKVDDPQIKHKSPGRKPVIKAGTKVPAPKRTRTPAKSAKG